MQNTRISTLRPLAAAALVGAVFGVAPAAAGAATVSYSGGTTTVTGTSGPDSIYVSREQDGTIMVTGATAGAGCRSSRDDDPAFPAICPGSTSIRVSTLGGDDYVSVTDWLEPRLAAEQVLVDLGDGNDQFSAREVDGAATVIGGNGNDDIQGSRLDDVLDGGPGNDKVHGFDGNDVVRGGDGDDQLSGDSRDRRGADLIDGGAGRDAVDDWWNSESKATITLDGVANDGFAGEADNVTNVEQVETGAGLDFDGDDGVNHVTAGEVATSGGTLNGRGGDDYLLGTDRADRIDGGPGADELIGGYGNDTIVGGGGPDTIIGDRTARCNEMHCDLSPGSASDTIDAVDGEIDTISCGPGNDLVRADAIDRVDIDCEQVTRVNAATPGGGAGGGSGVGSAPDAGNGASGRSSLTVTSTKLGAALIKGIKVRLAGLNAGARVTVTATVGGKAIGTGSATVSRAGGATVTVRLTKSGRRRLAGKKAAQITLRATGLTQKVTFRR